MKHRFQYRCYLLAAWKLRQTEATVGGSCKTLLAAELRAQEKTSRERNMCKENEGDILNKSVLYLSPLLHVLLSFTAKAGE